MTTATEKLEWGWTSYKRTLWRNEEGGKCYIGHFMGLPEGPHIGPPLSFERVTIRFWAHRPVLALREIASSGRHPSEFADTLVN